MLLSLAPILLHKAAGAADPDFVLAHLDGLLSALGGRTTYYSLLKENAGVIDALVKIFSFSEYLSNTLMARPQDLNILLSRDLYIPLKLREAFEEEFFSILNTLGGLTSGRGGQGGLRRAARLDAAAAQRRDLSYRN